MSKSWIVREEFSQAGFDMPTLRHYSVPAESEEEAIEKISNNYMQFGDVLYGRVPGSEISVVARAPY